MGTSLIDLGKLTKPATVLIEKISDAVGGIAKPWQIERVAHAQAAANIILAKAQLEISDMERRGLERLIREETRNQENIEGITAKAIPLLESKADPAKVDDDWLTHFFNRARIVSDEEMQSLWSNILAGEANEPGRFSKRTLDLVSILSKGEADLFTNLASQVFTVHGDPLCPIQARGGIADYGFGITFSDLTQLETIGLIRFDALNAFAVQGLPNRISFTYFDERGVLGFPTGNYQMDAGNVMLTVTGKELLSVCGAKPVDGFYETTLRRWANLGYSISAT